MEIKNGLAELSALPEHFEVERRIKLTSAAVDTSTSTAELNEERMICWSSRNKLC